MVLMPDNQESLLAGFGNLLNGGSTSSVVEDLFAEEEVTTGQRTKISEEPLVNSDKDTFKELVRTEQISKNDLRTYGKKYYQERHKHVLGENNFFLNASIDELCALIETINPTKKKKKSRKEKKEVVSINELFSTAEELHHEQLEPLSFTVQDFLPSTGAFILSSKPKTGKTFLALQMASCIASGERFLRNFDTVKGQVLYVMTQGGRRALKHRIDKVFENKGELKNMFYLTAIDPLQQGGYETLQNFINLADNPKLIVLDMITNMFPNIKHSNYQAWAQVFEELNDFAIENNISIICVYHSRKEATDGSDFTDDVLGSTGILGSVSGILTLRRSRDKGEGEIFINHREAESMKKTILFRDACWSYIGDNLPARPTDRKVFFLLKETSGLTNKEIADHLKKDKGNITRVLKRMVEEDFIYLHDKRYYLN